MGRTASRVEVAASSMSARCKRSGAGAGSAAAGAGAGAGAGKGKGDKGKGEALLVLDARGRCALEFRVLPTCTREHYQGDAHTPTCMHRIRRPVYLRVAVIASTWSAHAPASFLPVTLGPLAVDETNGSGNSSVTVPTPTAAPGAPAEPALQRRAHEFRFGTVVTLERPTAVLDGFGHVVWDAAFLLVKWLEAMPAALLAGRTVVEVGSGVGLVGLAAAALGARVVLTDMPDVLALTRANLAANLDLVRRSRTGSVCVRTLRWGDARDMADLLADADATGRRQPDVVLASDVVYQDALFAPLIATLAALAGPHTTVLLAARERHGCDFDRFLELLRAAFEVALAPLSGEAASLADACVLSKAKHIPRVYTLTRRPCS